MINIPKTVCPPNRETKKEVLTEFIDHCGVLDCEMETSFQLTPVNDDCPCPEPENEKKHEPIVVKTTVSCFDQLIKNIVKQKFCGIGPKCR